MPIQILDVVCSKPSGQVKCINLKLTALFKYFTANFQMQDSAKQKSVKMEPYLVLPPITPEYNDDIDPVMEAELEAQRAINDINQFDEVLDHKSQGKEPVNEKSIVLD